VAVTGLMDLSPDEVAALSPTQRQERVKLLIDDSARILGEATREHFANHRLTATVVLFSGGNDSTVLFHLMLNYFRVDAAAHANTGIGIEETREFVRQTCADWDVPLIERHPPAGSTYRELVLDQAFPGPGHHYKMFQRLKERPLREVRREFVKNPRTERVLFVAGRRRQESKRRQGIPEHEREGSTVWASPLANWHKLDLSTYRDMHPGIPRNLASDTLHMSGECLCGAFAHAGELDEIAFWFPHVAQEIRDLEAEVLATGKFPEKKCKWGWGGDSDEKPSKSGPLCQSCDARFTGGEA
jgi:3'-phosphoadenosine 5'-phosphosulfate sulfotransferase (PAPS reductase)/FAD synthetase